MRESFFFPSLTCSRRAVVGGRVQLEDSDDGGGVGGVQGPGREGEERQLGRGVEETVEGLTA